MADWAHNETDRRLEELEKRIREVYGEAAKEIKIKADDYFRKLENRDTQMRNMVNAGEITPEYYAAWRQAQIGRGERFEDLYSKLEQRMVEYDMVAIAYVNDDTPGIYSLNHDYMAYTIEQVHGNVDFTLYNEQAVRRLLQDDPDLFPQPSVDIAKDELWNRQKLQSALTSGILQGETLHDIAQRMQEVARMDRTAALRNARTAYTGAQNAGRQAAFERAARMGIKVQKRWTAIKDSRTRDSHGAADGQTVDVDEPFSIGGAAMLFPGDPSGPPREVYNCRCTMRTVEKPGIEAEPREMRVRDPITGQNEVISEMTYSQWREWKRNQDPEAFDIAVKKTKNTGSDKKQWEKYRNQLGKNAPQTLAQFQELKYNGDWEKYKSYAKAIRTGELTPMATFVQ
ncbi:MAG: hypothetical protein IJN21_11620 [Clostridia bacterium]|nr:hypothetical protein [Clostridia bacterium]